MRKNIIILLIFLAATFGFLVFPRNVRAACTPMTTGCNIHQEQCGIGGIVVGSSHIFGNQYCCDTAAECTDLQNGRTPGGPLTNPTCGSGGVSGSIDTAIGCIPYQNTNDFVGSIFKWAVGIGGGIAFLLIIYSGFLIMSSSGNPERLQEGRDLMTSAISGLILLVFSIFALKVIGIDILGLGAFGFGNGSGANIHTNQINGNQ